MKKLLFAFAGLTLSLTGWSQINYAPSNSPQFTLSPTSNNPPLLDRGIIASRNSPAAAFIFEYGDGGFTSEVSSDHAYQWAGRHTTVLSLSGRYDTIKPPKIAARVIHALSGGGPFPNQGILSADELVKITPISTTLNVRDEVLFIITYRLPEGVSQGTLYFLYNQSAFNVMVPAANATVLVDPASNVTIPRIRTHFGEQFNTATSSQVAMARMPNDNFLDFLSWTVRSDSGLTERNLFVTLRTKDNFTQLDSGIFKAGLVFETENRKTHEAMTVADSSVIRMDASADPHDPNYIIAIPKCIVKSNEPVLVNYHLHFQNEGDGSAHRLHIELFLDEKLRQAVAQQLNKNSFTITVGNKSISKLSYRAEGAKLIFEIQLDKVITVGDRSETFIDSSLSSNKVMNWPFNSLTMGDISFNIEVPADREADYLSHASIVFYSLEGDSMLPVETGTSALFVRAQCNENLFPLTPLMKSCPIILGLCWWWWIIIATATLLVIIFLWLLFRRRKNKEPYQPTGN